VRWYEEATAAFAAGLAQGATTWGDDGGLTVKLGAGANNIQQCGGTH
jgi:hypothetical protein